MWNGAAPNLKAMPATMNTRPVSSRPGEACDIAAWMPDRSSVPVAPYISDMPYSSMPEASEPRTKYFIAASEASGPSRSIATSAYWHSASISRPRYTVTRLPADTISIMPTVENSTSTGTSPLYRPRSRRKGQAYTSDSAEMTQVNSLSTSAATSRMNMPLSTVPCPPTPVATMPATNTSAAIESACVTQRWRSSRNRSSISSANAAPVSTSSGSSGSRSAGLGVVGIMLASKLGRGQLAGELGDGGFHQVGERLRIDTEREHTYGERAEHDPFPHVDVFEFGDVGVADLAEDRALDQPQRVGRAEDQRGGRAEGEQRMLLEAGEDHHEFADEARGARQARVGHAEQHHEHREPRHHVRHAAVVADHAAVHAVVEHADAREHRAGDEAVRNHLHHRALQAEACGVQVARVAHQREGDEGAQGHEAHVRDRRVRDQLLHVVLHQRDEADGDDGDERQRDDDPGELVAGVRHDRQGETQEAGSADLQHDRRQHHRAAGRRLDVRIRQPRVHREHRHLDRERGEEGEEQPGLFLHRQGQRRHVRQ